MKDNPIQVTGGARRDPLFDRYGNPINVGDRIRYQETAGRYGQTRIKEQDVTCGHWDYYSLGSGKFEMRKNAAGVEIMVGHRVHHDFEHGHETWIEVIAKGNAK